MGVVDDFIAELAERRGALAQERDRLSGLIKQVDTMLMNYGSMATEWSPPERRRSGRSVEKDALGKEKDDLRAAIAAELRAVYPDGLTTAQLLARIGPNWPHGELSQRRVGTTCAASNELAGSGPGPYYYVPAEGEAMKRDRLIEGNEPGQAEV